MVIRSSTAFSLRCTNCGYLDIDQINIFELSNFKVVRCKCGQEKYRLKRKKDKIIIILNCMICEYKHRIILSRDKFLSSDFDTIMCPQTNREIGYLGAYYKLKEFFNQQQQDLNALANKSGFDEFVSPEIVLEILDYLHDLAAIKNLYCECGSQSIYIDLFAESIRLTCDFCNNSMMIPATTVQDIETIKTLKEIRLGITDQKINKSKNPWLN